MLSKRIMLISDTHGNQAAIQQILAFCKQNNYPELIHLGDDDPDIQDFRTAGLNVVAVPGVWGSHYQQTHIANRRFLEVAGWRFFLSHTPTAHYKDSELDLKPEQVLAEKQCEVFLHGHTHIPLIQKLETHLYKINPGHLHALDMRGYPLTFATLEVDAQKICVEIRKLADQQIYLQDILTK